MAELNTPLKLGALELKNRVIMAPLTRSRATDERVPTAMMAEYYAQRASAGLIISEATVISEEANGYRNTPGLFTDAQVEGWKLVTNAVHEKGGLIVAQLWHVGRVSDPELLNGETPVSASSVQQAGHVSLLRPKRPYVLPRPLEISEIHAITEQYKQAAIRAKDAGFDGVELHGANGYLIDQFLQTKTNKREDEYGGSIENRARLLLQVVDAFIEVWGAGRVGVHLAPRADSHDMGDDNPLATFGYVVEQLDQRNVAFIFTREYEAEDSLQPKLRPKFKGAWIANEKLTPDSAKRILATEQADAVAFGLAYIANPDLFERLENDLPLNQVQFDTLYGPSTEGYTDYPVFEQLEA